MSQPERRNAGRLLLKVVTAVVLVIAVIENGCLSLALIWIDIIWIPIILGLSYFLFVWLRYRLRDNHWALLGTVMAAAAWPWTFFNALVWSWDQRFLPAPQGDYAAFLFGPLLPYGVLAAAGLWKRR